VNRFALLTTAVAIFAAPGVARADAMDQSNQVTFGLIGAYVPQQNDLQAALVGVGHYVAFSHSLDHFYLGVRLSISYGWFPGGASGQQWFIEPDAFLGASVKLAKPLALRFEAGTGPLMNGGEGFAFAIADHTYVRAELQATVVKTVLIEAFIGPSFVLGSTAAVFGEAGLGCGWAF
jgi:hypothetical protein